MKRKIIQLGDSLLVSLPAKWARRNGLDKGEYLHVTDAGNSLSFGAQPLAKRGKEISMVFSSDNETAIRTALTNAYRLGYDRILVKFCSHETLDHIGKTVKNNLIGFQVMDFSEDSCVIESLAEVEGIHQEKIVSKIVQNIRWLFQTFVNGEEFPESLERQTQAFDNYLRRIMLSQASTEQVLMQWSLLVQIIHGQRELYLLQHYLEKKNKTLDTEILSLLQQCKELFELMVLGYKKRERTSFELIHKEGKALECALEEQLEKGCNAVELSFLLRATRNFYLGASPLLGLLLISSE